MQAKCFKIAFLFSGLFGTNENWVTCEWLVSEWRDERVSERVSAGRKRMQTSRLIAFECSSLRRIFPIWKIRCDINQLMRLFVYSKILSLKRREASKFYVELKLPRHILTLRREEESNFDRVNFPICKM